MLMKLTRSSVRAELQRRIVNSPESASQFAGALPSRPCRLPLTRKSKVGPSALAFSQRFSTFRVPVLWEMDSFN